MFVNQRRQAAHPFAEIHGPSQPELAPACRAPSSLRPQRFQQRHDRRGPRAARNA
jgi:hypothetical protein